MAEIHLTVAPHAGRWRLEVGATPLSTTPLGAFAELDAAVIAAAAAGHAAEQDGHQVHLTIASHPDAAEVRPKCDPTTPGLAYAAAAE